MRFFTYWLLLLPLPLPVLGQGLSVHLDFGLEYRNRQLRIDEVRYANTRQEKFSVTRADYLVSDVSLVSTGGLLHSLPGSIGFIPTTGGVMTLPNVPPDRYRALTFFIGPDVDANHSDPAQYDPTHPLHPTLNNLHWDWDGGYIFLALEGHWRTMEQTIPSGYAYHFARDENRIQVTLPLYLHLTTETKIEIALDPSRILQSLSFGEDGATTHSAPGDQVSEVIKKNFPHAFRIASIGPWSDPPPTQRPLPIDFPQDASPLDLAIPAQIPRPLLPTDNPLTKERFALGKRLFHDPLLSRTNTISCSSCHLEAVGFTDLRRFSPGVDGKHPNRHSMPLFNLAWKSKFFWDGRAPSLREQVLQPIEDPLEMDETLPNVIRKVEEDEQYPDLFRAAFASGAVTAENISLALE
ncbi:MAG: MbnP family protein, partial [Verrucomicrobiota bacterium]